MGGGGDVAFVKHTTVMENCDGKRKEIWARNQLTADYQLLCRDGTRKRATDYRNCYLGKVAANAIVTNPFFTKQNIIALNVTKRHYLRYLGPEFTKAFEEVECFSS